MTLLLIMSTNHVTTGSGSVYEHVGRDLTQDVANKQDADASLIFCRDGQIILGLPV